MIFLKKLEEVLECRAVPVKRPVARAAEFRRAEDGREGRGAARLDVQRGGSER